LRGIGDAEEGGAGELVLGLVPAGVPGEDEGEVVAVPEPAHVWTQLEEGEEFRDQEFL